MKHYSSGFSRSAGVNKSKVSKKKNYYYLISPQWLRPATVPSHFSNSCLQASSSTALHKPVSYLLMVWSQYDPPTEGVAKVDHAGTAAETQDFGEGYFHG